MTALSLDPAVAAAAGEAKAAYLRRVAESGRRPHANFYGFIRPNDRHRWTEVCGGDTTDDCRDFMTNFYPGYEQCVMPLSHQPANPF